MSGTQSTNAACDTKRNCMSVHVCPCQKFGAILNSPKTPANERSSVKTDVTCDLFQIGPDGQGRGRWCFPLTFEIGRASCRERV